jgi:predicted amidohydrolase
MKVVARHVPLSATSSFDVLSMLQERVRWCEARGVEILCCPDAVLGGLADYANASRDLAIGVAGGQLQRLLAPLTSDTVATLWGGTELGRSGQLYNAAAVFHRGAVVGSNRKLYPAINRSIRQASNCRCLRLES